MLFLSTRFLFPSDSGGKIRTRDVLHGLRGGRFEVTLLSPQPTHSNDFSQDLAKVCDRFVGWPEPPIDFRHSVQRAISLLAREPISVATERSREATRVIAKELKNGHDVIVIDFPHANVLLPNDISIPKIVFTHNVESEIYTRHAEHSRGLMRFLYSDQGRKMMTYEQAVLQSCDEVIAVTERDRDFFLNQLGIKHVSTIPTGVDLVEFAYRPQKDSGNGSGRQTLVFVGSMDWRGNIDAVTYFMDHVWPILSQRRNDLEFTVVGRNPPQHLVERAKERNLPWAFTGFVDDVRDYVYRSQVYVIPLRVGSGSRIKAYQAMAMGCPVISTSIGMEGLPARDREHYLRADTPSDFAKAILALLDSPKMRQGLSERAHRFVADQFSADRTSKEFERICLRTYEKNTHHVNNIKEYAI